MTLMLVVLFASVAAAVFLAGEAATLPARERRGALERALGGRDGRESDVPFRTRVIAPIGARIARFVVRLSPGTTLESVTLRLLAAGRRDVSPTGFLARKGAFAAAGIALGVLVGASAGAGAGIAFAGAGAVGGLVLPDFLLSSRIRRRQDDVRATLPDALDLLAVSVEAGLGFDGAAAKLAKHLEGPLVEEFGLVLTEMRVGRSRHEALRAMAERVDVPELTGFARAVIQADRLGMSLGGTLRVQAEDVRSRRQTAAEEKAMKAPIKMLFPTVLFIFPAMFVVILGPALLNFSRMFP